MAEKRPEREAKVLREHNRDALRDWLDALPGRFQDSPDIEQVMDDNKRESRPPLKSANFARLDDRREHASDQILWRTFENELPRALHRVYDDAARDFLLSPNTAGGYIEMIRLEAGSPEGREIGSLCRRAFEYAVERCVERDHRLIVAHVERPKWTDFQHTETANAELQKRYEDHYRAALKYHKEHKKARAEAVKNAAADLGYTVQHVRRLVGD